MSQYLLVIIWLGILYLVSRNADVYTNEKNFGKNETRVSVAFAIFSVLPLIYWTATRAHWYFDTGTYVKAFSEMPSTFDGISSYMETVTKDEGFFILSVFIKLIFGNNPEIYFGVLASIQLIILALVFRKYSSNYVLTLFLFVASTDYLSWAHNGIRQFTAVILVFSATEWMLQKKYIQLIAVILLASTIHGSALLMLPVVIVIQGTPWNKKTMLAIAIFALAIFYAENFTNVLDVMLDDTQYTNVVSDWQLGGDNGTNPVRVFIYSVPTILSLIGYRYIRIANDAVINMACNMGILSTLLYLLSMVTSGIFIGRLPIYCSLYAMGILLPWELDNMFTKKSSELMKMALILGFIGFYYLQIHFIWSLV